MGALFGSFFNVCIYRIPTGQNLSLPRSYCYACGTPIRWFDNIPILTYFILRGRCRSCKAPFSIRYALIEFLTGLLFVAVFLQYGLTWAMVTYLIFTGLLLIAAFTDIDLWIIPDRISKGGAVAGILLALVLAFLPPVDNATWREKVQRDKIEAAQSYASGETPLPPAQTLPPPKGRWIVAYSGPFYGEAWWVPVANSAVGAAVASAILWGIAALGSLIFRQPAMGLGDVKLLVMIGAFTGWLVPVLTIFLASMTGAVYGLSRMLLDRIHQNRRPSPADSGEVALHTVEEIEGVLNDESDGARRRGWLFSTEEKAVLTRLLSTSPEVSRRHHIVFGPHLALAAWILMLFERDAAAWLSAYFSFY